MKAKPRNKPGALRPRNPTLITHLRDNRMQQGLTQRQLADKIGIDASQLSQWERNYKDPCLSNVVIWAAALGMDLKICPKHPHERGFFWGVYNASGKLVHETKTPDEAKSWADYMFNAYNALGLEVRQLDG